MVARTLWPVGLAPSVRARIAACLGLDDAETAGDWVAFWAGLHDIGKGSPAFAVQWDPGWDRILAAGFESPADRIPKTPHGYVSAKVLPPLLGDLKVPGEISSPVARLLGGHHGTFPRGADLSGIKSLARGGPTWEAARREVVLGLKTVCGLDGQPAPRGNLEREPWLLMVLAGLTSVADWIGSDERYFPFAAPGVDLAAYAAGARLQAERALAQHGWGPWEAEHHPLPFDLLFDFPPNPLQQAVIDLADRLPAPALVLVESPMGGGKTEAAMYLADRWSLCHGQQGCYFALPTQATSNQMFSRVKSFLGTCYPEELVNIQLLHGHAALSAEFEAVRRNADRLLQPEGIAGDPGYDGAPPNLVATEWFTRRKRGLLAPFGVGTVDQLLMSVLQTRHFFVRLFGLTGKTVIIDEVHSYDAYMSRLLDRLLNWLAGLGCSVVLLSATLPAERRHGLLAAFARGLGHEYSPMPEKPYPRLTWYSPADCDAQQIDPGTKRKVRLRWVDGSLPDEPEGEFLLGRELGAALGDTGGCAAVICNTVGAAQRVYQALKRYFPPEELDLFHARYLFAERDAREKRTLLRFSKPGAKVDCGADGVHVVRRPRRFVLVATQVIEQSLDLDFDLMVTEVAPVDLVLQRMGRLRRHRRKDRPRLLGGPLLWLLEPPVDGRGLPQFGTGNTKVYSAHVLLRSWMALRDAAPILIPGDVEPLIKQVYGPEPCPGALEDDLRAEWERTRRQLEADLAKNTELANAHLIIEPDAARDILARHNEQLEEENPDIHASMQALTRLGDPSVQAVFLYGTPAGLAFAPDGSDPVNLGAVPDKDTTLRLLSRSVAIAHRGLVPLLVHQPAPGGWRHAPLLRHHRVVTLDAANAAKVGPWEVELNLELGVLIRHGAKESE